MTDKNFHITLEVLRSTTIRYVILTFCIILGLFFVRKWFFKNKREASLEKKV
jgi:predicted permease